MTVETEKPQMPLSGVFPNTFDGAGVATASEVPLIPSNPGRFLFASVLPVMLSVLADFIIMVGIAWALPMLELNAAGFEAMRRLLGFWLVVYFGIALSIGAYDPLSFRRRRMYLGRAIKALAIVLILTFFAFFSLKVGTEFSRLQVLLFAAIVLPGVAVGRLALFPVVCRLVSKDAPVEILIIDGVVPMADEGLIVVDAKAAGLSTDLSDYENVKRLAALGRRAERIILQCPAGRRQQWAEILKCLAVHSEILCPELEAFGPLALGSVGHRPTIIVSEHPLEWRQAVTKRLFDIVVSLVLVIALLPVFVATAIAIKLDSPGPIFFSQKRLGLKQRTFLMFKFRSMRNDKADKTASKLTERNDPRVTKVGAFIRKTSIDELPQIINVLLGDMSLVGPRPHAPAALAGEKLYWEVDGKYWRRHIAKPGITGLAQVRGFRGNTFEEADLISRLDADLEYVSSWSLLRDVELLAMTFRVIVHSKAF